MERSDITVFYRHYNLPADFPLIVLTGDEWISRPEPLTRMHFHNCLEIGLLKEGSGTLYIGDTARHITGPAVTLVPANTIHIAGADDGSQCRWSWFYLEPVQLLSDLQPRFLTEIRDFLHKLTGKCLILPASEYNQLYTMLSMTENEAVGAGKHYRSVITGLFLSFFGCILRQRADDAQVQCERSKLMKNITPAVEYINAHFVENITVDLLAEICHISTSHFRRLFKQVFGTAPLEYIETVRIEYACSLLFNNDYSVTEVGLMSGFPSQSSFNRQFTRKYGVAPSKWRTKARSLDNPAVTVYLKRSELK